MSKISLREPFFWSINDGLS